MKTVESLLQTERSRKGFSQAERAALWKGIEVSLAPALPSSTEDPAPNASSPRPTIKQPPAAHPGSPVLSLKLGALVALAALGGAGLGAALHATWAAPKIVVVE